jgi:putative ABC transport system permease protein
MNKWLAQTASMTRFGFLTIPRRRGAVIAAMFGIAGVVAVLVGVLSIAQGFRRAMTVSASPENVLVLRGGSDSEMVSGLTREDIRVIGDAPGLARDANGPLVSAELFVIINLPKRSTGTDANVPLRGIERAAVRVRDNIQIVQGRMLEWGRNELVVGTGAAHEFAGLNVGSKMQIGRNEWEVVGLFTAGGGIAESEMWTDVKVLQAAYSRGDTVQSVSAKLTSAGAFMQFKDALTTNPRLDVKVMRQSDYYAEQSTAVTTLITSLGFFIAALMGLGAVFGALNTMYSSVSARTREIATLRALGFGSGAVVMSVLVESLALALAGGCIGGGAAYFAFDGFQTATLNWQSFSQVAFAFKVTPVLLAWGVTWAALIGLIGGLFPAIRAARLPIAAGLREL